MAVELRWEVLFANVADGTSASNAAAEFRNESKDDLFVRRIFEAHEGTALAEGEGANIELSKANAIVMSTNNSPFFSLPSRISYQGGDIATDIGRITYNARTGFAKGEIVLENNESLFVNITKTSGGNINAGFTLGYHF